MNEWKTKVYQMSVISSMPQNEWIMLRRQSGASLTL